MTSVVQWMSAAKPAIIKKCNIRICNSSEGNTKHWTQKIEKHISGSPGLNQAVAVVARSKA